MITVFFLFDQLGLDSRDSKALSVFGSEWAKIFFNRNVFETLLNPVVDDLTDVFYLYKYQRNVYRNSPNYSSFVSPNRLLTTIKPDRLGLVFCEDSKFPIAQYSALKKIQSYGIEQALKNGHAIKYQIIPHCTTVIFVGLVVYTAYCCFRDRGLSYNVVSNEYKNARIDEDKLWLEKHKADQNKLKATQKDFENIRHTDCKEGFAAAKFKLTGAQNELKWSQDKLQELQDQNGAKHSVSAKR